jgi:hypothetical protein
MVKRILSRRKKGQGRVKNATPNIVDGIEFKSKLESYTYLKLKENNIKAGYETVQFELLPAFTYGDEKIRNMKYTPDFIGDNFIIECKGLMGDSFLLRWKIFKYLLYTENLNYKLYMPRNRKQVDEVIQQILNG